MCQALRELNSSHISLLRCLSLSHVSPLRRKCPNARICNPVLALKPTSRAPSKNWQGFFCTEGRWARGVRNHKTMSALGRWIGFELDETASSLIGGARG